MPSPAQMLSRYLADFDLTALGDALGQELADNLLAPPGCVPVRVVPVTRDDLTYLLSHAAQRGVERFVDAAGLRAAVEGPSDEYEALAATIESVRAATTLICTDPDALSQAERAEMAAKGVHILLQLVHSWDAAKR